MHLLTNHIHSKHSMYSSINNLMQLFITVRMTMFLCLLRHILSQLNLSAVVNCFKLICQLLQILSKVVLVVVAKQIIKSNFYQT